jgi:hypothetical protein
MNLEKRVEKTINYLNSERGCENWFFNESHGLDFHKNLAAAVQTATGLRKYESIMEVYDAVNLRLRAAA